MMHLINDIEKKINTIDLLMLKRVELVKKITMKSKTLTSNLKYSMKELSCITEQHYEYDKENSSILFSCFNQNKKKM